MVTAVSRRNKAGVRDATRLALSTVLRAGGREDPPGDTKEVGLGDVDSGEIGAAGALGSKAARAIEPRFIGLVREPT